MVDELQDTNAVQLELIELIARGNLFTVGDAQQSIYGFRHADVELFERRGERLAAGGGAGHAADQLPLAPRDPRRAQRERSRTQLGDAFQAAARRAREVAPAATTRGSSCWSSTRAPTGRPRALGVAVAARRGAGAGRPASASCSPAAPRAREIVVLTRATTDLRVYERALEERGHPDLRDRRPRLLGPSAGGRPGRLPARARQPARRGGAVHGARLAAGRRRRSTRWSCRRGGARSSGRDPWWVLREPDGRLDELARRRSRRAGASSRDWFAGERAAAAARRDRAD